MSQLITELEAEVENITRQLYSIFGADHSSKNRREALQQKQKASLIEMLTDGLSIDEVKSKQKKELEDFDQGELMREVSKRKLYAQKETVEKRIEELKRERVSPELFREHEKENGKLKKLQEQELTHMTSLRQVQIKHDTILSAGPHAHGGIDAHERLLAPLKEEVEKFTILRDECRKELVKQEAVCQRLVLAIENKMAMAR